jgi:hydroxymethylbilane synthase
MAQAALAADGLRALGQAVAIVPLSTVGDRDRKSSFAELGGRGVFAGEIEAALAAGRIDVAVHSAKDLTDVEGAGLVVAACLERADPRDAWCGPARSLDEVAHGARVGTASLRRTSQLRRLRADLAVEGLRGNVDTRLRKRGERGLDGVLLAACGLDRLGLADEIGFRLEVDQMVPESGQGIVALQVRAGEEALVAGLDHAASSLALAAERTCTRRLAGGCTVPVAAHAVPTADGWIVRGYVGSPDGATALEERAEGRDPLALAMQIAERLLERGGAALLEELR